VPEPSAPPPSRRGRRLRRAATAGIAVYGATWLVNRSLRRVAGDSMLPGFADGDLLLTVPAGGRLGLRRGDVVTARTAAGAVTKRVVGLPGEDVLLQDGHLHVDGRWYAEPYAHPVDEEVRWRLGRDEVVLLGDHRAASTDSRATGPVPRTTIERIALARLRPWRWLRGRGPQPLTGPRRRPTVRIVVLDPDDRVLLFRVRDVDGTERTWWEAPGGGIRRLETPLDAAGRELAEELGHTDVPVAPLARVDERATSLRGAALVKVETLFAARLPDAEIDTSRWTPSERRDILETRWFTAAELADLVDDEVVPAGIGALITDAIAALAPATDAAEVEASREG
jgi:signal peptidase I